MEHKIGFLSKKFWQCHLQAFVPELDLATTRDVYRSEVSLNY